MKIRFIFILAILVFINGVIGCGSVSKGPNSKEEFFIFSKELTPGFDIGVDSSLQNRGWLEDTGIGMKMSYPQDERWGSVFIVSGFVTNPPRPSENFSGFKTLSFEIKGEKGGETVYVGLKDKDDPDDSSETKIELCGITAEWQEVNIPLGRFDNADLNSLYIPTEFVFLGPDSQTLFFRNVKFMPSDLEEKGTCKNYDNEYPIYASGKVTAGYDIGVDSSANLNDWLFDLNGSMKMVYPANQTWGAVFFTVGSPVAPPRPSQDFSQFIVLSVDLKGENGGENLEIGIKDNTDPDDGTETKIKVTGLTTRWQTYTFLLSSFSTADLAKIYLLIEFVFSGVDTQTVYFKNIKYAD